VHHSRRDRVRQAISLWRAVEPVRVVYADLTAGSQDTIARALASLELPVPAGAGARTALARQADELSEGWAARCL
jgi:LPS sulfotransferase NodH